MLSKWLVQFSLLLATELLSYLNKRQKKEVRISHFHKEQPEAFTNGSNLDHIPPMIYSKNLEDLGLLPHSCSLLLFLFFFPKMKESNKLKWNSNGINIIA